MNTFTAEWLNATDILGSSLFWEKALNALVIGLLAAVVWAKYNETKKGDRQ